jgi:hypothetical protein
VVVKEELKDAVERTVADSSAASVPINVSAPRSVKAAEPVEFVPMERGGLVRVTGREIVPPLKSSVVALTLRPCAVANELPPRTSGSDVWRLSTVTLPESIRTVGGPEALMVTSSWTPGTVPVPRRSVPREVDLRDAGILLQEHLEQLDHLGGILLLRVEGRDLVGGQLQGRHHDQPISAHCDPARPKTSSPGAVPPRRQGGAGGPAPDPVREGPARCLLELVLHAQGTPVGVVVPIDGGVFEA